MDDIHISYKASEHYFKIILYERPLKRVMRESLDKIIEKTNNEKLLRNMILSFLKGKCNKCRNDVSNLKKHRRYGQICYVCHKKYKP